MVEQGATKGRSAMRALESKQNGHGKKPEKLGRLLSHRLLGAWRNELAKMSPCCAEEVVIGVVMGDIACRDLTAGLIRQSLEIAMANKPKRGRPSGKRVVG